jgi:hypothetical protein
VTSVLVQTVDGVFELDLEDGELVPSSEDVTPARTETGLPRVVAAAAAGSTVVAVVEHRPPLLVSHDAGLTWRESGRGLPAGFAVAISDDEPDLVVYAGRNRLFLSRDGGRFWESLGVELPDIEAVAFAG